MANIIIPGGGGGKWEETAGERSLRQLGHKTTNRGVMEIGLEFGADELRKENVTNTINRIMKTLWELRQAMAEQSWDDDKVLIVIGMQARNKWIKDVNGEWVEEGLKEWLDNQAVKSMK